jgi:hypothetical protein
MISSCWDGRCLPLSPDNLWRGLCVHSLGKPTPRPSPPPHTTTTTTIFSAMTAAQRVQLFQLVADNLRWMKASGGPMAGTLFWVRAPRRACPHAVLR